jgi:hypothetical protein
MNMSRRELRSCGIVEEIVFETKATRLRDSAETTCWGPVGLSDWMLVARSAKAFLM